MAGFTEEEYEQSQDATPVDPPRGSADWAAQNSGDNAPELTPTPNPAPGTLEAYEAQQTVTPPTGGASTTPTPPPPADSPAASTDTEHQTPALSPEQQQRVDATAGTDRQIKTIQDWIDSEENRPETPEQRKKRERREKSKRIIAAVSDGISALSNLFFTTQYAPNMYNHEKGSMTTAEGKRLDQLKAEREKKRDQYLNFFLKLGDLENQRAATLRELEAQQERQKLAREKAQREAEAHGWLAALQPDKRREQKGKADRAEQEAIIAQAEAEAAPELQQAKLATERARKGSLDASAANSRASAAAHGRSNQNEFSAWDEHGNERKFRTREAAEAYAKQHGTWKEEDETETTTTETRRTPESKPQKRTSTKTTKGGHAGKPSPTGRRSPTA